MRLWPLLVLAVGCISGPGPSLFGKDDATAPPTNIGGEDGGLHFDVALGDPFAILGLNPSHGPFTGGTRTVMAGRGFNSQLEVWVGGQKLDPSAIFASDPTRAALTTPPGAPGPVDVKIRDPLTAKERTLPAGFVYDAFEVIPDSGSILGGTRIGINAYGTAFATGTTVDIGGKACGDVLVVDATHLECTTAPSAAGSKDVTLTLPDTSTLSARDAYTYNDSSDAYRNVLSGGILSGKLKVIAIDSWTGNAIPAALAIVGTDASTAIIKKTDGTGSVQISDSSLTGKVTVTVAEKCHQPMTFVDVQVDTVTAYLSPVMDLACAKGDPQQGPSFVKDMGAAVGELIFPIGGEFQTRGDWTDVPSPKNSNERRAAYVFVATSNPLDQFWLPVAASATTMGSPGIHGYSFSVSAIPGNATIYALAGIEDTTSTKATRFTPYVMGVTRGVPIVPSSATTDCDIKMSLLLDHKVSVDFVPPTPTSRGPDRLNANVAVSVGALAYAILPTGQKSKYLPNPGTIDFIGMPALETSLTAENYIIGGAAVTGPYSSYPASIVRGVKSNDANKPIAITGFLPVPIFVSPGLDTWNGKHVEIQATGAVDLLELIVSSGGGLVAWSIISPKLIFDLPDLAVIGAAQTPAVEIGLKSGGIRSTAYVAHIDSFKYTKLKNGQLGPSGWNAYAYDSFQGAY